MNIYEKLLVIQNEIKATKDLRNEFGRFNYRSAERIYEAVKPICKKYGAVLRVTDEVVLVGDKPYIKAIAELIDVEMQGEVYSIGSIGWARIPDSKKGMDDSQLTGSASSYANKYCVSALLLLDDNKDADALPPDDKYEEAQEKTKAMKRNKERLDELENWRMMSEDNIEVKAKTKDGGYVWKNLDNVTLKGLEFLRDDERFEGIKQFVEQRIAMIKKE